MAYENVQLSNPNFCVAPVAGTFATLHDSSTLRIVNSTGALQGDYTLSSSITNALIGIEYVGPRNLSSIVDDLTFFTIEKASSSSCIIKRWEIDPSGSMLDLVQTITKNTSGANYFNGVKACVEYYERSFDNNTPNGVNNVEINSTSRITSGMTMYLGPSSDPDSLGLGEYVTVDYTSGGKVYFTSNIVNEYFLDDKITFYKHVYILSSQGYNGVSDKGTLFQLSAYDGSIISTFYSAMFKKASASKWYPTTGNVPCVVGTNMVYVAPYNSYLNWRAMSLNNLEADKATTIPVVDLAFDGNTIYKLMRKVTKKDDDGIETTTNWSDYNYQQDSLLPYTNSIQMYTDKTTMVGPTDATDFTIVVRDQFGVGLTGVDVTVARDGGDSGVVLDPIDGQVTTNSSGIAYLGYTGGSSYNAATKLTCKAAGGSASTGSVWVWDYVYVHNKMESEYEGSLFQVTATGTYPANIIRQLSSSFDSEAGVFCKTYITNPGGDWVNPSAYEGEVATYLPMLIVGDDDGPQETFFGWLDAAHPGKNHLISQVSDFESEAPLQQLGAFEVDFDRIKQIDDASHDLQISQLKMVHHTSWVDGVAYDELFTDVEINQFVFVEDAIPAFWSVKNPIDTNIWIRLRPYAFDLDQSTLKFYVKEVSYAGNTDYVDMASYLTVTTFDAGGGLNGLDITCNPPNDFHYAAVVYVKIEVYDTAASPNFIWVDYWFEIIPDYRKPYLENLSPSRDEDNVAVDTDVYFEIKDVGVGVDIDTLEMTMNSRIVTPTNIEKVTDNHYKVTYNPASDLLYNKNSVS